MVILGAHRISLCACYIQASMCMCVHCFALSVCMAFEFHNNLIVF